MKLCYFDHAATTAVNEEVLKEMFPYFSLNYGNASSMYQIGRKSHQAIELARKKVANAIGAKPKEIYFTGCGSESDNLAIKGFCRANKQKGNHIITTKIEHPAVLHTCKSLEKEGFTVTYLSVNPEGRISIEELERAITNQTILISIMFANNEIGTIQPIKEISVIAEKHHITFHTDAVQAVGNVAIDVEKMGIDMLCLSSHKFYGPKGVGGLYIKEGILVDKIQDGGHQERDKRAGTENVAGIVGTGKAIELACGNLESYNQKLQMLRDYYFDQLQKRIPQAKINGDIKHRLPGNANVSFPFIDGQSLLFKLDERGICASAGSACSTGMTSPSHVLLAIGLKDELANGTLRVTFGEENTKEEVDYLLDSLEEIIGQMSVKK